MHHDPCLAWASNALSEYLRDSGIPDYEMDAFSNDDLTVVLMGATQQGKTSLALRLLGADPSQIPELDNALSGGSKTGRSRTRSTQIIRAVGSSDYSASIKRLTQQVLNAKPHEELHLDLPLDGGKCARITRVIDLVGLESRTETDEGKQLAEEQARKWLQRADLKLVVVRASAITDIVIGRNSWTYKKELRDLFGYWSIDPHTSFIAVTFAWEDTKKEVINGMTVSDLLIHLSDIELHNATVKHLKVVIKAEFEKELDDNTQSFPDVTILPFSLPPVIDMDNPTDSKIYHATQHSFDIIMKRVSSQKPIVFKLKSVFSHPKKFEAEIRRDMEMLAVKKAQLIESEEDDRVHDEEDRLFLEMLEKDIEKIGILCKKSKECPTFVLDEMRKCFVSRTRLNLPSISGLRDISTNSGFLGLGGKKKNMKENISNLLISNSDSILSSINELLQSLRNQSRQEIPEVIRNCLPRRQILEILKKAILELNTELEAELELPENWHRDDGWFDAKSYIQMQYKTLVEDAYQSVKTQVAKLFSKDDIFEVKKAENKMDVFRREMELKKAEIKKANSLREMIIEQNRVDLALLEKNSEILQRRLASAMNYKRYLNNSYIEYWNQCVYTINNTRSTNIAINMLGELSASSELFEEIAEFASHDGKSSV